MSGQVGALTGATVGPQADLLVHALQAPFQAALLHDSAAPSDLLKSHGQVRFDVYRQAYRARLRGALRDNYEVLPLVMGDDDFDALANAYIDAHPSVHYSLRWFGHALADFMATHDDLVGHPAMLDLARMEWALRSAFDAATGEDLAPDALGTISPDQWPALRFGLHPAVQLLSMQWAVGPVWHALKEAQDEVPAPEALAHHLLVWRLGLQTQWKSLSVAEANFVQSLQVGRNFGDTCDALALCVGEDLAAPVAAQVLREFLGNSVIAYVVPPPTSAAPSA